MFSLTMLGQNQINLKAFVDVDNKQLRINQSIEYFNTTNDTLNTIYLNDWSNSYATKTTPLAKRFTEEFSNKFHFARNEDRGFTVITSLKDKYNSELRFSRLPKQLDIIKVELQEPLLPNTSYIIGINYIVKIPSDSFTRYGINNNHDFKLRYWYISPAVYDGKWHYYSNKDLDDMFIPISNLQFEIEYPRNYQLTSELDEVSLKQNRVNQIMTLHGNNRVDTKLLLNKLPVFKYVETDYFTIVSDIDDEGLQPIDKAVISDKIAKFITENLGEYPHNKLLLTDAEYRKDPIYGLNLLPDFITPYPNNFQYELKLLKTALRNYLLDIVNINPRDEYWLLDSFQIYLLMKYVEQNYPDTKLLGKLSKIWGLRSFHVAKLDFNDQYNLLYMNIVRVNLDQPLTMQKDSLLKFNKNIANKYKAGIGMKYLDAYINGHKLEDAIKEFIAINKLKTTNIESFKSLLQSKTSKDLKWFFTDYLSNKEVDFKIKKIDTSEDSLKITIRNKKNSTLPITLFSLDKNDAIISKHWLPQFKKDSTIVIPNDNVDKLVLNQDHIIPEINLRNNTKSVSPKLLNKPLQVRLFKDVEHPDYNQIFVMPLIEYRNIYDGLRLGGKLYNKTFLKKPFLYRIAPQYATNSNSLTGSAVFEYNYFTNNRKKHLYKVYYGLAGSYSSYGDDLFVRRFTPTVSFSFRDKTNLRANKRQFLNFRFVDIKRDKDIYNLTDISEPNYSVFNIRYVNKNPGLVDFSSWFTDFQVSRSFSKVALNYEFRRLYQNNRQLNIRFFAGVFLSNKNDDDYFSFALDRPTDYLFDYDYLGRSESTGIFSQQIIIAEGGFKSKLDTPFANQWMTTLNTSTSIWKYIHAYGDIGLVKNKHINPKFVYDSGVRFILVEDYFEIYFPVYSNLGWEVAEPNYSQKIRFLFTIDPQTLLGLFTRKWY